METTNTNTTTTNHKHELNKIIAMVAVIILSILIYTLVATVHPQKPKVAISQDGTSKSAPSVTCQHQQISANKQAELDQAIQDAKDALATVDASLEEGEGTRLMHTAGFPLTTEGQTAIRDLDKAVDNAKKFKDTHTATGNGTKNTECPGSQGSTDVDTAIKTLQDQTQSFIATRDAYRQAKATEEVNGTNEDDTLDY